MGLHLGDLVLGEIGAAGSSARTIIGDAVNVASRLEGQTKALGAELLVSAELLQAAGYDGDLSGLQSFELRGVTQPVSALPVTRAADLMTDKARLGTDVLNSHDRRVSAGYKSGKAASGEKSFHSGQKPRISSLIS